MHLHVERLPQLQKKFIVLASASPRRAELLRQIGISNFKVVVSDFEEDLPHAQFRNGAEYAKATARHKAMASASKAAGTGLKPDLIIAADTVVECDGQFLEKAQNAQEAVEMLTSLSNSQHQVHTGVALVFASQGSGTEPEVVAFHETTTVEFAELSDECIRAYVATGESFGKAGSYGIQQIAGCFVKRIEGCYFNVVGLPIHSLSRTLAAHMDRM